MNNIYSHSITVSEYTCDFRYNNGFYTYINRHIYIGKFFCYVCIGTREAPDGKTRCGSIASVSSFFWRPYLEQDVT
jgi:hypothetical protein